MPVRENDLRILIVAPTSNDGRLTAHFLQQSLLLATVCDIASLSETLRQGCGALLIAEEALDTTSVEVISAALEHQPSWSDLPIIIITGSGESSRIRSQYVSFLGPVGNVSIVERPVRPETIVSTCEVALRSRRRQYEVRDLIAEREQMVAEAQRQTRIFDTTLSSSPDFTYIFDREGRFAYANKSLLDLLGLTQAGIVGKTFAELPYSAELAAKLHRQIQQVFETGATVRDETPYTNPAGNTGYYEYIFSPVMGADGNVEVVAGATRDTSERRRNEERLREDDRRKDEFLAMLAHELRNPLAAVANAALVLRSSSVDDQDWAAGVIERQTGQLVHIIDDLLDVSRITTGKIQLRKEVLDVAGVLRRAQDSARAALAERKHSLESTYAVGELWVEADATRLEQIVVNLLTNAAKYTPTGGEIQLLGRLVGQEVQITVSDNGIGISPERMPAMFELFAQGERSIARSEGGLGIGLTIVKRLVEMHDGRVEAHSDGPDCGSRFTVCLPYRGGAQSKRTSAATSSDQNGTGRRILLVDDNKDMAQGMKRLLTAAGHTIRIATDGLEALKMSEKFLPSAVILDIGLPGMDGYEVARRLREATSGPPAILIAMTGYGQPEDKQRAISAGFDHHLVKPVDFKELKAILSRT